jgi:uncharacterized protein (DUF2164 family)
MKELLAHLFQFVLFYGIKDKVRFRTHALGWLEKYDMDESTREEFVEFAYEFLVNVSTRLLESQIVESGVHKGVASMEKKMEDLNEKLEMILKKMPEANQS